MLGASSDLMEHSEAAVLSCSRGSRPSDSESARRVRGTCVPFWDSAVRVSKATRLVTDALNRAKENRDRIVAALAREPVMRECAEPAGWSPGAQAKRIATAKRTEKKTALFSKYDQAKIYGCLIFAALSARNAPSQRFLQLQHMSRDCFPPLVSGSSDSRGVYCAGFASQTCGAQPACLERASKQTM